MSLGIAGMGWITPLGGELDAVWQRLLNGEEAPAETISSPLSPQSFPIFRVPPEATAGIPAHPRLRRCSAISRFAVGAGLAALEAAELTLEEKTAERMALIFAISNGGVVYTKRFYHDIVKTGAQAASPLLFPETVFNAPASHLAAILGITGASYTLVGDGAVGVLAVKMAEDLMEDDALDFCLVVGAEEADWLLGDAYHRWRLLRAKPPIEPFRHPPRGMILSEGAGAIVFGREGKIVIDQISAGANFTKQSAAGAQIENIFAELAVEDIQLVSVTANGTFIDQAEAEALERRIPKALVQTLKPALGESVGAASIWQIISAAQALRTKQIPPTLHLPEHAAVRASSALISDSSLKRAIVSTCGLNQQVAGLRLSLGP